MLVKKLVDVSLGNSSYLIASEESGEAAVLDPERDVVQYLQIADGLGLRIIYAPDTHLHNDFVSGTREIAARVGDAEWAARHLPAATHVELGSLPNNKLHLPKDELTVIHCGHSDRSTVGVSLLEQRGYRNLALLRGGYSSWLAAGLEIVVE